MNIQKYLTPDFKKKAVIVITSVLCMGFFLSFLIDVNLGTDPCTFMNLTISGLLGLSFGNWQLLLNAVLLVFVLIADRHMIGIGTIANMVLIGYVADFCRYLWSRFLPQTIFTAEPSRAVIFALALFGFIVSASFYMNSEMGLAPYDATSAIIGHWMPRIPFHFVRIAYDMLVILIGLLAGGRPNIGTILMAFVLGPMITIVGRYIARILHPEARPEI